MATVFVFFCITSVTFGIPRIHFNGTLNESRNLLYDLMYYYDKDVRPVANFTDILNLTFEFRLKSIQDFDEVRQSIEFGAGFALTWYDAGMVWDPRDYADIWKVEASYGRVWTPDFILATSSEESLTYGKPWQKISYEHDGYAYWYTVGLIKSTCRVNVRNYPFDTQVCNAQFILWGYTVDEIDIVLEKDFVDLSEYTESGSWFLERTTISNSLIKDARLPQVDVRLFLKRKTEFVLTNVLAPLFILNLMNILVFVLVPESGERVSYCITVLLAITVFLTIISDTLPENSEPMPIISYKLMTDLVLSALITVATIFNLRLYHRPATRRIPKWLRRMYTSFSCSCSHSNIVNPIKFGSMKSNKRNASAKSMSIRSTASSELMTDSWIEPGPSPMPPPSPGRMVDQTGEHIHVTWANISKMLDYMFFTVFLVACLGSSAIFIITVAYFG